LATVSTLDKYLDGIVREAGKFKYARQWDSSPARGTYSAVPPHLSCRQGRHRRPSVSGALERHINCLGAELAKLRYGYF